MKYVLSFLGVLAVSMILAGGAAFTVVKPIADSVQAAKSVDADQVMLSQRIDESVVNPYN